MAIAAVNAAYRTAGPTVSGQILASNANSDSEVALVFTATVTLDGSTTTFNLNFIDGTATLSFTPSAVLVSVSGGTQQAAAYVGVTAGVATNVLVPIYLSGAGTSANTLKISGIVLK
jgi:hypothetical protein